MRVATVLLLCPGIIGIADGFNLGRRNRNPTPIWQKTSVRNAPHVARTALFPLNSSASADDHNLSNHAEIVGDVRPRVGVDRAINSVVIGSIVACFALWLYHVDASLPHPSGPNPLDSLTRVPIEAWESYSNSLVDSPIATKAATSASVYALGDVISQTSGGASLGEIDRSRTLRSLVAGFIGHGPLSHFWYIYLDSFFVNVLHMTEWWSFIPKVLVDQTTLTPIWNNSYILLIGIMRLDSFKNITSDMRRSTIPLMVSGLKLWPFAHMVTYGLLPQAYRLAWVDLVEILWVTILATQAAAASTDRDTPCGDTDR